MLGHHHDARRSRQIGQQRAGLFECLFDRSGVVQAMFDGCSLVFGRLAHLHHGIDEQAQPALGGHPACAGMRRSEQAQHFQLGKHRADRGGR